MWDKYVLAPSLINGICSRAFSLPRLGDADPVLLQMSMQKRLHEGQKWDRPSASELLGIFGPGRTATPFFALSLLGDGNGPPLLSVKSDESAGFKIVPGR